MGYEEILKTPFVIRNVTYSQSMKKEIKKVPLRRSRSLWKENKHPKNYKVTYDFLWDV